MAKIHREDDRKREVVKEEREAEIGRMKKKIKSKYIECERGGNK